MEDGLSSFRRVVRHKPTSPLLNAPWLSTLSLAAHLGHRADSEWSPGRCTLVCRKMSSCSTQAPRQPCDDKYKDFGNSWWGQSSQDLAEPEVCDLDVALLVEHHIVQLEVPVEHAMLVQVEQGGADLSCIEPAVTISASTEDLIPDHYVATGSLNLPDCWMWNMRSPPGTNSRTK